ncbi:MAG: hypothetical protein ABSE49_14155 [Polyangiaceae bacterium]|jgi:hypothetical protein
MNQTAQNLKAELEKSAALLRTVRDEVRVRIHLSGMEAKDAWQKLEPSLEAALERAAKGVSDGSHAALAELTEAHRKLREWRR